MKKINRLAAAMAVALSMTAVPQANAEIEFHPSGRGDALLFPVFNGYIENYFTIMNNHDKWIQGHLRFRGAAWSGELRDFDVILSPGDVFVFRVADIDGDGQWEIDQSLDPRNFQYTGLNDYFVAGRGGNYFKCGPEEDMPGVEVDQCMDPSNKLMPRVGGIVTEELIELQKHTGYVEFIGEAVLDGLDYNIMQILLSDDPGVWRANQTKVFSKRGTTAWAWSDAANGYKQNRGLSDVPNALSGTAFLTIPGVGHGLAYNAEALVNFRTATIVEGDEYNGENDEWQRLYLEGEHRIDNYLRNFTAGVTFDHPRQYVPGKDANGNPIKVLRTGYSQAAEDRAVIVHDENAAGPAAGISPVGDYVYQFDPNGIIENRTDESRISFNNTWGPTLADGDDYDLSGLRNMSGPGLARDDWDQRLGSPSFVNSIAEVEEAIRLGVSKHPAADPGPQVYSAYYMDGDIFDKSCEGNRTRYPNNRDFCPNRQSRATPPAGATTLTALTSYYFAFFPTKFYYGESPIYWGATSFWGVPAIPGNPGIPEIPGYLKAAVAKLLTLQKPVNLQIWNIFESTGTGAAKGSECISPATSDECSVIITSNAFGHELTFLGIEDLKKFFNAKAVESFLSGRVVVEFPVTVNNPKTTTTTDFERSWPGLMYTFEWDGGGNLAHWRPMQRMHR